MAVAISFKAMLENSKVKVEACALSRVVVSGILDVDTFKGLRPTRRPSKYEEYEICQTVKLYQNFIITENVKLMRITLSNTEIVFSE